MVCGCSWSRKMNDRSSAESEPCPGTWSALHDRVELFDDDPAQLLAELTLLPGAATRVSAWSRGVVAPGDRTQIRGERVVARPGVRRRGRWRDDPGLDPGEVGEDLADVAVVGDPRVVEQVLRLEVLPEARPAREAGADGHRRSQAGVEAGAPGRATGVDGDAQDVDGRGVLHDDAGVVAVHDRGVPGTADAQDRGCGPDPLAHRRHPHHAEDRAE